MLSCLLRRLCEECSQITPQPQQNDKASFAPILKRTDGLIDWANSAVSIERLVRGFQPWPNAFTHAPSSRLVIWQAEPIRTEHQNATSGKVLVAAADELIVKSGQETALRLIEVQPEAKRRMSVRDYLNGTHLPTGYDIPVNKPANAPRGTS